MASSNCSVPWLGCLALLVTLSSCNGSGSGDPVEFKVPVSVAKVELGDVEDLITATGTLRASEVVTLTVESAGILEIANSDSARRLGEGDRVVSGQTIAEITGEDVRLAARTEATQQAFESAEVDYAAASKLYEQGLNTETELRRAETALEEARFAYDRSRHTETRNRLVSPIDGVILRLARDPQGQPMASGQLVSPGLAVAEIAPTAALIADVDLVGPDVARVTPGMTARIRHHAWEKRPFAGTLIRLAPTIDSLTRALRAEVEVDNSERLLRPGMFVEVTLVVEQHKQVPVVPRDAVTNRDGRRVVFVLKGPRVAKREVTLGLGDDTLVEVRKGLEEGERIVTRGLETLTDQTQVRVSGSS